MGLKSQSYQMMHIILSVQTGNNSWYEKIHALRFLTIPSPSPLNTSNLSIAFVSQWSYLNSWHHKPICKQHVILPKIWEAVISKKNCLSALETWLFWKITELYPNCKKQPPKFQQLLTMNTVMINQKRYNYSIRKLSVPVLRNSIKHQPRK